jgi:hypothetical protein
MKPSVLVAEQLHDAACYLCHPIADGQRPDLCGFHYVQVTLRLFCFLLRTRQLRRWHP